MYWKHEIVNYIEQIAQRDAFVLRSPEAILFPHKNIILHLQSLALPLQLDEYANYQAVIVVWEDIWHCQKEKIKAKIQHILGLNTRVFARNTRLQKVNKPLAEAFLNQHHLLSSVHARQHLGLYRQDELLALASFSNPRNFIRNHTAVKSYEMLRFVSKTGFTVTGGLSKILKYFLQQHSPCHLMTYIDKSWSDGAAYHLFGFECTAHTSALNFYVHPQNMQRMTATNFKKSNELPSQWIKIQDLGNLKLTLLSDGKA